MTKILSIGLVGFSLFFSACAPLEYKKYGEGMAFKVGYSEFKIKNNLWKVSYTGEANGDPQLAMKFMYQRINELCTEQGFNDYDIMDTSNMQQGSGYSQNMGYGLTTTTSQTVSSATIKCVNRVKED